MKHDMMRKEYMAITRKTTRLKMPMHPPLLSSNFR
jgi:hypothetical protein